MHIVNEKDSIEMRNFSEVLEEYLTERDLHTSGYYKTRPWLEEDGQSTLNALADELDEMVRRVKE
jgi:hypothetical protein